MQWGQIRFTNFLKIDRRILNFSHLFWIFDNIRNQTLFGRFGCSIQCDQINLHNADRILMVFLNLRP